MNEIYDILFIDIPTKSIHQDSNLRNILDTYYAVCNFITENVTEQAFNEKPYYYTTGLLCLSTYLKKENLKVGYLNYNVDKERYDSVIAKTKIICFSVMTVTLSLIDELIIRAKSIKPDLKVVLGGYHATFKAEEILSCSDFIDVVILGEGEIALLQYVKGVPIENIEGIAYKKDDKVYINRQYIYLKEEDIPLPDYSLIEDKIDLFNIQMSTMRGCIGECRYCVNHNYWGKPRFLPLKKVKKEIAYLSTKLERGTLIHFTDNVFTINKKRLKELSHIFCTYGKDFKYECDTLASLIDNDVAEMLLEMNVVKIQLGFEDCDDKILEIANKNIKYDINLKAAEIIRSVTSKICIYAYWLIGLPGTTKETIEKNINEMQYLISNNIVDIISPKIFIPYPGTDFFENSKIFGLIIKELNWDDFERRTPPFPYELNDISGDELFSTLMKVMNVCEKAYFERWSINKKDLIKKDE